MDYSINDVRTVFRNITFSNFQKSKAKIELIKNLQNSNIESSCYWSAEFICAGHFLDLWDIILLYVYKHIHIGNPRLTLYINMRYNNFITILKNGYSDNILSMRNNDKIRKLFAEIICILALSTKKNAYTEIKLDKESEFDITNIGEKFKAPTIEYISNILKEDDPKELIIPVNELIYNLCEKNIIETCYWFEWIIEYENICKKKKKKCDCNCRTYAPKGFTHDIIWIIWDILFYFTNNNIDNEKLTLKINTNKEFLNKIISELFNLFIIKYNNATKKNANFYYILPLIF